ncbi:MAG TPA: ABC transporter substrate-binding protein, partial [Acidimicrobiales bacterium]|nr:ABC transporter substrate-binding protein [Acidimicrobiales bacterium]
AMETALTANFNPFDTSSPLGQMGVPWFIYEPLLEYNELQVDQYYPWLAESWSISTSGETITFDLRHRVKWADGSVLPAADVAYTFNLLKDNPDINDGIPIVSAIATNPTTFVLTLSTPGYSYLYNIARVPIVKSGYAMGANPATYVDTSPDGTGPYMLARRTDATPRRVTLTALAGYWQGAPPARQLVFPAYTSTAAVELALRAGSLDWAADFMPNVVTGYVNKNKADNHFWAPPVDCISLELNLARYPFDILDVREALSAVLDRVALSSGSEGGYAPPATSSSGLVLPTDHEYVLAAYRKDIDDRGDLLLAVKLMQDAGFHLDAGGFWASASGKVVSLSIEDAAGSPLSKVSSLVAEQLTAAGFNAATEAVTSSKLATDLSGGNFDGTVLGSTSGPSPYYMYENWLDPALLANGRTASGGDYERFGPATDPAGAAAVTKALQQYVDNPSDSAAAQAAIEALATVVSEQLPVIPLMYGVAWAEFSTRHASGWPNAQNPYEPAQPLPPFAEYTVLQLSPGG